MADGSLLFDTHIDGSGFNSGVSKLGGSAKKGLTAVSGIITAVIGSAVAKAAMECVNLASDLQEVQNVVDVTFGESAGTINDWSRQAANAFGLSELSAKQYTGTMGAMLKSSGVADEAIVQMSTDLVGLSGDFASFFNIANEEAFAKIRSGISGETEPLKQLGINMSVANLEAYALSQGIEKSYSAMTQAEQVTLRYNYLLSVSADAQGDFARTSDGLANQQRVTKLAIQNLGTAIGSRLIPAMTKGTTAVGKFTNGLAEAIDERGIRGAITYIRTEMPLATAAVTGLATAYGSLLVIKTVQKAVQSYTAAQSLATTAAELATSSTKKKTIAEILEAGAISAKEAATIALTGKMSLATRAQLLWNAAIKASPLMVAAAAIGAFVGSVVLLDSSLRKTNPELYEASDAMFACREESKRLKDSIQETAESVANMGEELSVQEESALSLADELMRMSAAYEGTTSDQIKMQTICDKLNGSMEGLNVSFDEQTGAVNMSADAIKVWIENYSKMQKMQSLADSYAGAIETQATAEKNLKNAQEARLLAYDRLSPKEKEVMQQYQSSTNITRELATSYAAVLEKMRPYETEVERATAVMQQADEQVAQLNADIESLGGSTQGTTQVVGESFQELKTVIEENQAAMDEIWQGYYNSAKENLSGVTGLFNTLGEESITSFDEMNKAIDSQLAWQQRYSDNLANLQGRNIAGIGEFASRFADGTQESANYVASFAQLSDDELQIVMDKMSEVGANTDTIASAIADMNAECDPEWQKFKKSVDEAIESLNQSEAARTSAYETGMAAARGLNSAYPIYKSAVDRYNRLVVGGLTRAGGGISGSFAKGLSYVPYDGFIAELHKGERVLTAKEAAAYNDLAKTIDHPTEQYSILQQSSSAAATADYSGIVTLLQKYLPKIGTGGVYLDKHTLIGEMAPEMNDEFGRIAALQERSTANA